MRITRGRELCALIVVVLAPGLVGAADVAPIDQFEEVVVATYTHSAPDFSLQYPYTLRASPPIRKGEVFNAAGPNRAPSLNVMVLPRPAELTLAQAALAAAKQLAPNGTVKAQRTIDLGGTPGEEVTLDWSMPIGMGVDLRSVQVSAFNGDAWVIVTATDGRVGESLSAELTAAVNSLRFTPAKQ